MARRKGQVRDNINPVPLTASTSRHLIVVLHSLPLPQEVDQNGGTIAPRGLTIWSSPKHLKYSILTVGLSSGTCYLFQRNVATVINVDQITIAKKLKLGPLL